MDIDISIRNTANHAYTVDIYKVEPDGISANATVLQASNNTYAFQTLEEVIEFVKKNLTDAIQK